MEAIIGRANRLASVVLSLAGLACAVPAHAATYTITTLDYPGADVTQAFGHNEAGTIVGGAVYQAIPNTAFVYDPRSGTYTPLPSLPDYQTGGIGINEAGIVVGSAEDLWTGLGSGFIYDKGDTRLFSYPGAIQTVARAVNNRGLVTGYARFPDSAVGFIYDPATGSFTDVVPSRFTIAQGINDRGEVVGSAFLDAGEAYPGSDPGTYGFARSKNGVVTLFRVNDWTTRARGISSTGIITGFISRPDGDFGFTAKVPTGGGFRALTIDDGDLLAIPGAVSVFPQSIDNAGKIVGSYVDENFVQHGFVAKPAK